MKVSGEECQGAPPHRVLAGWPCPRLKETKVAAALPTVAGSSTSKHNDFFTASSHFAGIIKVDVFLVVRFRRTRASVRFLLSS